MNSKRLIITISALFLGFALTLIGFLWLQNRSNEVNGREIPLIILEKNLPPPLIKSDLKTKNFDGIKSHKDLILVNFWASWCFPCKEEFPVLKSIYEANKSNTKFKMIGIASSDEIVSVMTSEKFLDSSYSHFFDSEGAFSSANNIFQIPQSLLVNSSGKIVLHIKGKIDDNKALFINQYIKNHSN